MSRSLHFRHSLRLCPCLVLAVLAALPARAGDATVTRRLAVMGTRALVEVTAPDPVTASSAAEAAVRALETAEARLSTWRAGTLLSALNACPPDLVIRLDPVLARELSSVLRWWRRTGGAFNPAMGPLVEVWDLRGGGRTPSPGEILRALAASDPSVLELHGRRAVRRSCAMLR